MTDQLDRMLRAHDPAASPAARAEADDLRARLDARLDELPSAATESVPRSPARFGRRAVGLVAAAAAVSTAYLLLPVGQTNAYATWTATPQAVAERDAEVAVQECRDAMSGPFWSRSAGGPEEFDPIAATVMLTERRGDVVSVLLWDEGPMKEFAGSCLVELEPGASSARFTAPLWVERPVGRRACRPSMASSRARCPRTARMTRSRCSPGESAPMSSDSPSTPMA